MFFESNKGNGGSGLRVGICTSCACPLFRAKSTKFWHGDQDMESILTFISIETTSESLLELPKL